MINTKMSAGDAFPLITVKTTEGESVALVDLQKNAEQSKWSLVLIYRGQHCPICLKYLNEFNEYTERLAKIKVNVVTVSADTPEQFKEFQDKGLEIDFPVLCDLSIADMKKLGLYISQPTSDAETDHDFAEPGLYLVNPKGVTTMIEIANAPFIRPNIEQLVGGIEFAMEKEYPVRGTRSY